MGVAPVGRGDVAARPVDEGAQGATVVGVGPFPPLLHLTRPDSPHGPGPPPPARPPPPSHYKGPEGWRSQQQTKALWCGAASIRTRAYVSPQYKAATGHTTAPAAAPKSLMVGEVQFMTLFRHCGAEGQEGGQAGGEQDG